MRLIDKKLVNATLATERKTQIDAGVKIAEKVDEVRKTLAEEQLNLETFRRETTKTVQEEIDLKIREKDALMGDIKVRRAELAELQKPLDSAWEEVKKASHDLEKISDSLKGTESDIQKRLQVLKENEKRNSDERLRIVGEHRQSTEGLFRVEQLKEDTAKELMRARAEASKIVSDATEREEAVVVRESEIEEREGAIQRHQKDLETREKDMKDREKKFKANQDIFIRSQAYLKNKV